MLRAVVIGINNYADPRIQDLSYAVADAAALARLLDERIHPAERTVKVLLNAQATQRNVKVAIGEELAREGSPNDLIFIYFAGHGTPETRAGPDEASRYLVAHDTEYQNIYATGLDMARDFPRWFERIAEPRLVLVIVDACFSGRAGGRTFEGPALRRSRATLRSPAPISLKAMDFGEGRFVLAASGDKEVARESARLRHGIFTHHLLSALTTPTSQSPLVSVLELYEIVANLVRRDTGGKQTPTIHGKGRLPKVPVLK